MCLQPVPGLAPPSTAPLLFQQREAEVVDRSPGWERNVTYAQTVQNFLLDTQRKPRAPGRIPDIAAVPGEKKRGIHVRWPGRASLPEKGV